MSRYSELRAPAAEFVFAQSREGGVIVLAPTLAAADEVARMACNGALLGVHRYAFRELVAELASADLLRRRLAPVGRSVREALAARVTAEAMRGDRLTYLRPVAKFPGFPRALAQTFEELRLNGVALERLRECGQSGPDLALLLQAYAAELAERRLADHAVRVQLARETVEAESTGIPRMAIVSLDVTLRSRLEQQLYDAAMASARARLELRLEDVRPNSEVEIFSTSGEALECVEIARRIGKAAEAGVAFDEIGILLRSPERHEPLVMEALRRAGIPRYCARGAARPDAAGRSFAALLDCAEEGLSASRFAEYLSLGQMADEEEPVTPAAWERLLVDAAVVGGAHRWKSRLAGLREELQRLYGQQEDEEAKNALRRRIASLENLAEVALPIVEKFGALPQSASWGAWIEELTALAHFTLRDPERVVETLDELEPMADIGPVELAEVLMTLRPRLNSLLAAPAASPYGKVWVGSIEEARGLAFRQVFVPGVNEGLFPRPPAEDPLLLEAQRRTLGIALRPDDQELLDVAIATASERLSISFSRVDLLTGRERVPSFYAFAVHRAAGGEEIDVREFEARARAATGTRIGWPAPADPAEAIDDAEFDLATLAPLAPGSGTYLKKLPGRAVESLRARWARWHKSWKAADGLIVEEIGNRALAAHTLAARAWSPSVLQQYARCPYRFALRGIFGLQPAEEAAGIQRIDAATRGQLYHQAQFELLRELAAEELLPIEPPTLEAALARLDGVLERVMRKAEEDLAPAIPQVWRSGVQAMRADLRGWLQERAALQADWTPEFFELSFGLTDPSGHDPRSSKESIEIGGGFRLRGSIDLVERHRSGILRVVDHKTGRIPDPRPEILGGGEALQPILYGLAAEKILGEQVAFGRLSYATIAQNYDAVDVQLNAWQRKRGEQALHIINDAIRDGFLPAAPRKDACKHCDYLPVCGPYEEERVAAKSAPELKPLKDLRGWK